MSHAFSVKNLQPNAKSGVGSFAGASGFDDAASGTAGLKSSCFSVLFPKNDLVKAIRNLDSPRRQIGASPKNDTSQAPERAKCTIGLFGRGAFRYDPPAHRPIRQDGSENLFCRAIKRDNV
jgi:hypothetical protein